jgi:8-oxo-dGTP pyrophosphatase MutT (NUDIX family)
MNEDCFHLGIKGLIINKDKKILLLKVNTKELKEHQGEAYWDIPGGRIHKGDTIEETLKREIEEEIGIKTIESINPFLMVLSNIRIPLNDGSDIGLILYVFWCQVTEVKEVNLGPEHVDYGWFEPSEASKLLEYKYPLEFTSKIAKI